MPLEPRVKAMLRVMTAADNPARTTAPFPVRRQLGAIQSQLGAWIVMPKGPEPAETFHRMVPVSGGEIMVRLYRPTSAGPHPLYVFFHGGGWCVGTVGERDARCRVVSAGADCVVASVDYRMAPENRFPTAAEDSYAAVSWLRDHAEELGIDGTRVAVGGESAGANLAAVVCLMSRDRGGPAICHQWLDVPPTDATLSQSGHREVPDGYGLDAAEIDDFTDAYAGDADRKDPLLSPLFADDHHGLPPAWIMTAEYDKLRGDGEAYAQALIDAGVATTHVRLAGHIHPSFAFTRLIPSARRYEQDAIAALAAAFAR